MKKRNTVFQFFGEEENSLQRSKMSNCDLFVSTIGFCGLFSWITDSSEFYKLNCVYEWVLSILEIQSTIWEPSVTLEETHCRAMWQEPDKLLTHHTNTSFYFLVVWVKPAALASLSGPHHWIFTANLAVAEVFYSVTR